MMLCSGCLVKTGDMAKIVVAASIVCIPVLSRGAQSAGSATGGEQRL